MAWPCALTIDSNYGGDVLPLPATASRQSFSSLPHPHTLSHGGELSKKP